MCMDSLAFNDKAADKSDIVNFTAWVVDAVSSRFSFKGTLLGGGLLTDRRVLHQIRGQHLDEFAVLFQRVWTFTVGTFALRCPSGVCSVMFFFDELGELWDLILGIYVVEKTVRADNDQVTVSERAVP